MTILSEDVHFWNITILWIVIGRTSNAPTLLVGDFGRTVSERVKTEFYIYECLELITTKRDLSHQIFVLGIINQHKLNHTGDIESIFFKKFAQIVDFSKLFHMPPN